MGKRKRYKKRKANIHTAKPVTPVYPDPLRLIHNWVELQEVVSSETHWVEVEEQGTAYIHSFSDKDEYPEYISSHAFYGGEQTRHYNRLFKQLGFNIELVSWEDQDEGL